MSSDYDVIRADNIRRYGEDTDHLEIIGELYSDRTHFIFELLQNTEDALKGHPNPTSHAARFDLYPDRLELRHFGKPFDGADVRGVCGIRKGTKADDPTMIGKFGIGFKSVYAFTSNPEIHSGEEHFRVQDYVRPYAVAARAAEEAETLIALPFDRHDVRPSSAYSEIAQRLRSLDAITLLFLRHIDTIDWRVHGPKPEHGCYTRSRSDTGAGFRKVRLTDGTDGGGVQEWLIFDRPLESGVPNKPVFVECAFLLDDGEPDGSPSVVATVDSPVVVFFPTKRETHFGFLIQGPFVTIFNRENIWEFDRRSIMVRDAIAELVAEVLPRLRDMGLLTISLLEALPISSNDFRPGSFFRPIYDAVAKVLAEQPLLPTAAGQFVSAENAVLVRGADLVPLLSDSNLALLLDSPVPLTWLSDQITQDRTWALWQYLTKVLNIPVVDPEILANHFSAAFIQRQSDDWVIHFYRYLDGVKSIWRASNRRTGLRLKPFIRLQDGTHVSPFTPDNKPNAYLPTGQDTLFPIVKKAIAEDEQACNFLKALGLEPPDAVADIIDHVLPKYSIPRRSVHAAEHQHDIRIILRTYSEAGLTKRTALVEHLKAAPFVLAENAVTQRQVYLCPTAIYASSPLLLTYFATNPNVHFAAGYSGNQLTMLVQIGVLDAVPIRASRSEDRCEIYGLQHALRSITAEKAAFIWNHLLAPNREHVGARSGNVFELTECAWLPNRSGRFCKPSEISLHELPAEFQRDIVLAQRLKLKPDRVAELAREVGVDADLLSFVTAYPDAIRQLRDQMRAATASTEANAGDSDGEEDPEPGGEDDDVSFRELFAQQFARPGVVPADPLPPSGPIPNPRFRRDQVQADIQHERQVEPPPSARFRRVSRKVWEDKNNAVRPFLEAEYQGSCQLCNSGFHKRDGTLYFEGVYVVPFTHSRWSDRAGSVLCLCPTCSTKFMVGAVEADNLLDQILSWRAANEGGTSDPVFSLKLCDQRVKIRFTERHILDLQELLKSDAPQPAAP